MTRADRQIAQAFKRRLVGEGVPVREVRVYGSRARGTHHRDSDLDVFLVLDRVDRAIERLIEEAAWAVGFAADRVITTVEVTEDQMLNGPLRASPFLRAVLAEGVVV